MDAETLRKVLEQQQKIFDTMTKSIEVQIEAHTKTSAQRDLSLALIVGEALNIALDDEP